MTADRPIQHIAVIGVGTMGRGIAAAAAVSGYHVRITDLHADSLAHAPEQIVATLDAGVKRGKLTSADRDAAIARVVTAATVPTCVEEADLVIEAIPENLELKQTLFTTVDETAPPHAVLATNTSSLSITAIAAVVTNPERLIGMHFFNPVAAMKLVELVRGDSTSEETIRSARAFAESLEKTAIVVHDTPGFATSRLGVVLGLEAMRMLEQGVASAEDIDRAMELGYNHPIGPLKLTDVVGLDIRLAIADHLYEQFGSDTYRAPDILRRHVAEGKLGKKTGVGFYDWSTPS